MTLTSERPVRATGLRRSFPCAGQRNAPSAGARAQEGPCPLVPWEGPCVTIWLALHLLPVTPLAAQALRLPRH